MGQLSLCSRLIFLAHSSDLHNTIYLLFWPIRRTQHLSSTISQLLQFFPYIIPPSLSLSWTVFFKIFLHFIFIHNFITYLIFLDKLFDWRLRKFIIVSYFMFFYFILIFLIFVMLHFIFLYIDFYYYICYIYVLKYSQYK